MSFQSNGFGVTWSRVTRAIIAPFPVSSMSAVIIIIAVMAMMSVAVGHVVERAPEPKQHAERQQHDA
jgi:hypothetical protein